MKQFFNFRDLQEWFGTEDRGEILGWLITHGVKYYLDGKGNPTTTKADIATAMSRQKSIENVAETMNAHIAACSTPRADFVACGIYFLLKNSQVVYVGQSVNIHARLQQHINENTKNFDAVHFVKCAINQLNETERRYITLFRPIYNAMIPSLSCFDIDFGNDDIDEIEF